MPELEQMQTRLSLLFRLTRSGPIDERAWEEFVEHYTPLIYRWCRKHKLQDADAKDVTQQVLLKLAKHLPDFSYDPSKSFRAWLRTLSYHAWVDFLADQDRKHTSDSDAWTILASVESREDLLKRIDDEFDLERLETAMARVRERVEPATWESYRLTAIERIPAKDVARQLGKQVAAVYMARSNVQKLLQEELSLSQRAEGPWPRPSQRPN
jgi:RNA polymerase sigma-70 factor (ECF subfamily)